VNGQALPPLNLRSLGLLFIAVGISGEGLFICGIYFQNSALKVCIKRLNMVFSSSLKKHLN
jgi:hypothetical protein